MTTFEQKIQTLRQQHEALLARKNEPIATENGMFLTFRFVQNGIYAQRSIKSPCSKKLISASSGRSSIVILPRNWAKS